MQEKPVLDAFWSWVETAKGKVLPKSKLGEALKYAHNHKQELLNYLQDGNCVISNNLAENSIRPFTVNVKTGYSAAAHGGQPQVQRSTAS